MNIDEFVKEFAEQFDDTDVNLLSPETMYKELDEWSSYIALSVMAMVEENYEVELTASDFNGASTLQDLFDIIKSRS